MTAISPCCGYALRCYSEPPMEWAEDDGRPRFAVPGAGCAASAVPHLHPFWQPRPPLAMLLLQPVLIVKSIAPAVILARPAAWPRHTRTAVRSMQRHLDRAPRDRVNGLNISMQHEQQVWQQHAPRLQRTEITTLRCSLGVNAARSARHYFRPSPKRARQACDGGKNAPLEPRPWLMASGVARLGLLLLSTFCPLLLDNARPDPSHIFSCPCSAQHINCRSTVPAEVYGCQLTCQPRPSSR